MKWFGLYWVMRAYRRVRVRLPKRHRVKLDGILNGGIQPVRVVLRALTLWQLHQGKAASEVADNLGINSRPSVRLAVATRAPVWTKRCTTSSDPARCRCWTTRSANGSSRWFAPTPHKAMRV